MNIQLLKYALEVSRTGSMTKAAANLYMSQPNLSRAIKELEELIGVPLFKRTSKGIFPTAQGEEFLVYARSILQQIDELETMYQERDRCLSTLRLCAPRTGYIGCTVADFVGSLDRQNRIDVQYKETNAMRAISYVLQGDCDIAIVRYPLEYEGYFTNFFREKDLKAQPLWRFETAVLLSADHPLAKQRTLSRSDFDDGVELAFGDPYIPSLPASELKKTIRFTDAEHCVTIYDRNSAFQMLNTVRGSFMCTAPVPAELLRRYDLVERHCPAVSRTCCDTVVCHRHHKFSAMETALLRALKATCAALDARKSL